MNALFIKRKLLALACLLPMCLSAAPLVSLDYRITGVSLQVSPAALSVPKGIAGSVLVSVVSAGSTTNAASAQLSAGAYVQAVLRGPAFPEPRVLVGAPNAPLLLPPINLVGNYELDSIRLVDAATGQTRMEGSPSSVPVQVFDQVLISRVTSRPLTLDEIQSKGIAIDEQNFRAVQFDVAFVLDGKTIPVSFPVVSPQFKQSTELIPAAELEARLKQAAVLNQQILAQTVQLPPELQTAQLNIQVQGVNFQVVDPGAVQGLGLAIPPIPALMVIPGNIGFLHQFFSVQTFTENGAPLGSGLSVSNVQASLLLPPGPDGVLSTNYDQPGDDPLRFARIGPNKIIQPAQTIVNPGPDGQVGTADDLRVLQPGQSGQAEFLVEGLQEGLAIMNLDLTADLYGLVNGVVQVKGKAAGSVLVRNPRFSIAFSHPRTVRSGEPYQASVTVLNTGITPANLVSITLNHNSISGAVLASGQSEIIQLGTILPGQTATATYRLVAQRTGAVSFSNLSTSDDSTTGRFRFSMGIDERGVALSPDSLALPDFVNSLPLDVLAAANRVLGQALSVATAGKLPAGVLPVPPSMITQRVLELAEAGQRLQYGDPLRRVLPDLLRDWQGGRQADAGFDQLLRETDAGAQWRAALFAAMEATDGLSGTGRLLDRAADLAGLGQDFVLASAGPGQLRADFPLPSDGTVDPSANLDRSAQPYALVYGGTNGNWAVTPGLTNAVFIWTFTNGPPVADMAVLIVGTNGQARQLRWTVTAPPADAVYRFALSDPNASLQVDLGGDGTIDATLSPSQTLVNELPPSLVAVEQDLSVVAGRPSNPCGGPPYFNYGTVVAVVFSKPVTQTSAGTPGSYTLEGDNAANSVQVQPSGRVALLNLRKGISAIRPRTLTASNVADARGNGLVGGVEPVRSVYPGTPIPFTGGVAVRGRVLRGDGTVAAGVPVTLTMYDQAQGLESCIPWVQRVSQVLTDPGGNFDFDFVMSGIPYSISATDTGSLTPEALQVIMESTVADSPDTQRLLLLATSDATKDTLLGAFAAASLPQAIAKVEGLDRALVHDFVGIGSSREGQEVPVALRFRGRGTIVGTVVGSDGSTPVGSAAVNLFPDPDSREQGRGVFADSNGQFAFSGVPLGVSTISVSTSDNRQRTVAVLLNGAGGVTNVIVALPDTHTASGTLAGQVFDADNLTPNGNGTIFVGHFDGQTVKGVVALAQADNNGFWVATNVPVSSFDIVAVTFDGTRKGVRLAITPTANTITYANVTLEAATRVFGRVQFADGRAAPNALVAGGSALVRSDVNGNFELEGVPVGSRNISAGLERDPAAGIAFPRLGSAGVNVIAGQDNYVVVKLRAAGRIFGRVLNARGQPVSNIRVAIPQEGGFYWTDANTNGDYVFENLGLGSYTLSAPANAVSPQLNTSALLDQIRSGNEDQILAAFEEAATVFVGANDPLLTGAQQNFRPSIWGYSPATIRFDGDNVNADVHFLIVGNVSGTVLNSQGVPIGARVRLTGLGPDLTGLPTVTIRGEMNSDPATGQFTFPHALFPGSFGLQAASPFFPVVISLNGFTTPIDPDASGLALQFPPERNLNGSIAGRVFYPDGTLVGQGTEVKINFSADYQIQTDRNGVFNTQIAIPAVTGDGAHLSYLVEAFDSVSGLKGRATVTMSAGITNMVDVHLLTRGSTVQVLVLRGNGQPASGALITLDQGTYPNDPRLTTTTDTNGIAIFSNLWEGSYAVSAQYAEASTLVFARGGGSVGANQTLALTLRLGATGSIQGTFVSLDLVTPIIGAEVAVGNLGFASTDTTGYFRFDGVPLGSYTITSADPVTGAAASASANLTAAGQTQTVQLIEALRGQVSGFVLDSYGVGYAAGATVMIGFSDGVTPGRTVTTGPDGSFVLPGSPMGRFNLNATYVLPDGGGTVSGSGSGILSAATPNASVQIQLQPLGYLPVRVVRNDGVTRATNATVVLQNGGGARQKDVDGNGEVTFADLALGGYSLVAFSRIGGELHNGAITGVNVTARGTNALVILQLPGVGQVQGTVLASDGLTPAPNAELALTFQDAPYGGETVSGLSDAQGRFSFSDVPVGRYRLTAASQSLAASTNGTISLAGQTNNLAMQLGASGTVLGRLVRADRVTPVGDQDVVLTYASQSANPGIAFLHVGAAGRFEFDHIPVGAIHVSCVAAAFGGIIDFDTALTANNQTNNLGDVVFDEDLPQVVQVMPADTATGVSITNIVELIFNEALRTNSVRADGIFIRDTNGVVAADVRLLADTNGVARIVDILPSQPLRSLRNYQVIVLSGDLLGATGGVVGSGPRDLVGRTTPAPFVSHFSTADNDPPRLLSLFPSDNAVQIDPAAAPRLVFNETIQATGFVFIVTGPGGAVAGAAGVGVNGQVLSFVPAAPFLPNATYTLVVSNVFDLAGNRAAGEPFTATFATLDTIGPAITNLQIVGGQLPVAGTTIQVEAILATNEAGASVRFTQDFNPIGSTNAPPYRINVTLPTPSTLEPRPSSTIRAIATDLYGNDGPFAELTITVQSNNPPTVQFTRVSPALGPTPSGSSVVVNVSASDDSAVSLLRAIVGGAGSGALTQTNSDHLQVQGLVPSNAVPGQAVQVFAEAIDNLGVSSGQQVLAIPVSDNTPPALAILAPADNERLAYGPPLVVQTLVSDNSSNVTLGLVVSGGISVTQTLALPLTPNVPMTNVFTVPLTGAPTNGGTISVLLTATDDASNTGSIARTYRLPDLVPPLVQSLAPTNGETNVAFAPTITAIFSEPMDTNTVNTANFQITQAGATVAGAFSFGSSNSIIFWRPAAPLTFSSACTVALTAGLTDLGGNSIAPQSATFTVTDFGILQPANGAHIVEGQRVNLAAGGSNPAGIGSVEFHPGTNVTVGLAPAFTNSFVAPLLADLGTNALVIGGLARSSTNNLARGQPTASSPLWCSCAPASLAVDGNKDGNFGGGSVFHSDSVLHAFWEVDLGYAATLNEIDVYLRTDCCAERNRFAVLVANSPFVASDFMGQSLPATYSNGAVEVYRTSSAFDTGVVRIPTVSSGRYVRVALLGQDYLMLAEVEVFSPPQQEALAPVAVHIHSPADAPQISLPSPLTLLQGVQSNFTVSVFGPSASPLTLRVEEVAGLSSNRLQTLNFAESGAPIVSNSAGGSNFTATLQVRQPFTNDTQIRLTAQDALGLVTVSTVAVFTQPNSNAVPQIQFPDSIQLTRGIISNFSVTVSDTFAGLSQLRVGATNLSDFPVLRFAESGGLIVNAGGASNITATLQISGSLADNAQILLTAQDTLGVPATKAVSVMTLPSEPEFWVEQVIPTGPAGHPFDQLQVTFSQPVVNGTFTVTNVSFSGPGGSIAPSAVNVLGDNRYEIAFPGLTGLSNYSLAIDTNVVSVVGKSLARDHTGAPGPYQAQLFTQPITIDSATTNLEGLHLILFGPGATINGFHAFGGLEVLDGATVTHASTTPSTEFRLDLALADNLLIDAASKIDVSGRGYVDTQPGAYTLGNTTTGGATGRSAGSYGGLGAAREGGPNGVYGDFRDPNNLGSAGNNAGSGPSGGAGGGLIRISALNAQIDGLILANGQDGTSANFGAGAGSGGGIRLDVATLSGAGQISADGGNQGNGTSAGGGGRVAVYYSAVNGFNLMTNITAHGGSGGNPAAVGTVFFKQARGLGQLLVASHGTSPGVWTPLASTTDTVFRVDALVLSGTGVVAATVQEMPIQANAISILNGAVLNHQPTTPSQEYSLRISIVSNLLIDAASKIDVSGRGYVDTQPGAYTLGNTTSGGANGRAAGSYGGLGAARDGGPNAVYGDYRDPNNLGSAGNNAGSGPSGGPGGGLIRLSAASAQIDGLILANGQDGTAANFGAGAGSGGGIRLDIGALSGSGQVSANGGNQSNGTAAGGGGRVAIYYTAANDFNLLTNVTADGGSGNAGSVGTVFLKQAGGLGQLWLASHGTSPGVWTPLGSTTDTVFQVDALLLSGPGVIAAPVREMPIQANSISLLNGALLNHQPTTPAQEYSLRITIVSNLLIDAASRIDVSGRGYIDTQPGAYTLGNTTSGGANGRSAGSYGGLGAARDGGPNGVYGDYRDPNNLGSAGNNAGSGPSGGPGGGLIRLSAQNAQIDGMVLANGQDGTSANFGAGAGSGGGIRLDVATLSGSGQISANGGNQSSGTAAGGGGRVAVYYTAANGFNLLTNVTAHGGGGNAGAVGTVFLKPGRSLGQLWLASHGTSPGVWTPLGSMTDTVFQVDALLLSGAGVIAAAVREMPIQASAVSILNGAVLNHQPTTPAQEYSLHLTIAGNLLIDAASRIDVSGRGYIDTQPGAYTVTNTTTGGATGRSGGSYGGLGIPSDNGAPNAVYGDPQNPANLGSAGNNAGSGASGGSGGGLVRLTAHSAQIDGMILANGQNGASANFGAGAGSGGGIRLDLVALSGLGQVRADGGNQASGTAAGGGGRVAIYSAGALPDGNVSANGGTGPNGIGGAGSVVLTNASPNGLPTLPAATLAPAIKSITISNHVVTLRWSAIAGAIYRAQYTASLTSARWIDLSPDIRSGGPIALTTDDAPESAQRFYRVLLLPPKPDLVRPVK